MRISTAAIGLTLASLSLGACSGKHDDTSGNTASVAGTTAAGAPTMSAPKPGLWQMTISAAGMPRPMTTQACVAAPPPGVNPFAPPPQPGQACSKNAVTRTAAGYSIASECKINGMTLDTTGEIKGDFSSAYTIAMKTRMIGPNVPAAMQAERASTMDAKYLGACPAGMAPGTAKQMG